jgi:hypothetical protein
MKYILTYFTFITLLFATGDPAVNIKLTPMAVNMHKQILFATQSSINRTGSYSCSQEKYGWLVVSASGLWDEQEVFVAQDDKCIDTNETKRHAYKTHKIGLQNPDSVLKELMHKYRFHKDSTLKKRTMAMEIKAHQTCFDGECIEKSLQQKTLYGYTSLKIQNAIYSDFYYEGVAIFHNVVEDFRPDDVERKAMSKGAKFNIPFHNPFYKNGYPISRIDGVVLFEPYGLSQEKQFIQITEVLQDIYTLLKTKKEDLFNKKYIHKKYGLHVVYRLGIYDSVKKIFKIGLKNTNDFPIYPSLLYAKKIPQNIKWKDVSFDCMEERWSDNGFFLQKVNKTNIVSNNIKDKQTIDIKIIEKNIYHFVDTINGLSFYMKYIAGQWYMVILDEISGNCDA